MLTFKQFLREQEEQPFGKLKHLEHSEDHFIDTGEHGYHKAINSLGALHAAIRDKNPNPHSAPKITVKYDGSPSIVFGRHPQTKKFFVATKSAFNKDPKINYTHDDIEKNHGHAPGLVHKLKHALEHLPKVAPKSGVYQGDMMYSHDDLRHDGDKVHFTPNTITYTANKKTNPEHYEKAKKAKIGVVVHTKYHGKTLEDMSAGFDPDTHNFKNHDHVHVIPHTIDLSKVDHSPENQRYHESHISLAKDAKDNSHPEMFDTIKPHSASMKMYINHTVRTGEKPNHEGYVEHVRSRGHKEIEKLKTASGKQAKLDKLNDHINHLKNNKKHFEDAFEIHHNLQKAKDHLIHSLNTHQPFEHSIAGAPANPEGYVADGIKLVNRSEFSRANFAKGRPGGITEIFGIQKWWKKGSVDKNKEKTAGSNVQRTDTVKPKRKRRKPKTPAEEYAQLKKINPKTKIKSPEEFAELNKRNVAKNKAWAAKIAARRRTSGSGDDLLGTVLKVGDALSGVRR